MKSLKMMIVVTAMGLMLAAGPGYAQAPAAQPPATPPAAAAPAPAPRPPAPFPEGVKFAVIDIQAIASNSAEGKAATAKLDDLRKKKNAELVAKQTSLKALDDKLASGGSVMNDQARGQLQKDIEKARRDLEFAQTDAQQEVTDMTNELQGNFQEKLNPVIEQLRVEKGLLMIFSVRDSGIVAIEPGLDLSGELIKRFDAAAKTPAKK
jgi:outer membrane protein